MKTAMANRILKRNRLKMSKLNRELKIKARYLATLKPTKENDEAVARMILAMRENRDYYNLLQEEINDLVRLESWIDHKGPV